jgi:Flp pilus assembly pilin Flp
MSRRRIIRSLLDRFCRDREGQDVAEYAIMLAVVLVIIIGNSSYWIALPTWEKTVLALAPIIRTITCPFKAR